MNLFLSYAKGPSEIGSSAASHFPFPISELKKPPSIAMKRRLPKTDYYDSLVILFNISCPVDLSPYAQSS